MTPQDGSDKALALLARLAQEFTVVLSLSELVERVLGSLRDEVGFDSCTIALLDERKPDLLTVVGATGLAAHLQGTVVPEGQGLEWAAIDGRAPIAVADVQADPRATDRERGWRSGIFAPLITGVRAIGVIGAQRREAGAFTRGDLDVLALIAAYLAGAFEVARLHEHVRELAFLDPLTEVVNRRGFADRLGTELMRSRRSGRPLSIVLVDLNGFKQINDTFGHAAGDAVLRHVARTLRDHTRAYDLVARYGGDEFILLFPDTPPEVAEKILRRFRSIEVPADVMGAPRTVTLGWGIASWPMDGDFSDLLVDTADARLVGMKTHS